MFSIIMPLDDDRLPLFAITKRIYDTFSQEKEFLIPTRRLPAVQSYLEAHDLMDNVRLLPYTVDVGFNCSKALNLGTRNALYDNIVITCPEVMPLTGVLDQFEEAAGENIVCQVFDQLAEGSDSCMSLVNRNFRGHTPAMYFLAMFQKANIEAINGWDEDFMAGYAYEDDNFGGRWVRSGLPFSIREDIQALHQWHPRSTDVPNGLEINKGLHLEKQLRRETRCVNGLYKETEK